MSRRSRYPSSSNYDHYKHREKDTKDQTRGIEFQDDSLSSIDSEEESYLHQHPRKKPSYYPPKPDPSGKLSKNDKSGANHHQPDNKPHSDSTSERLGRLEAMLEQLIKRNVSPESPVSSTVTERPPQTGRYCLEPRRHDFTTSMWINRIQEASIQSNWDEKTTVTFMESKMSGIIKAWYNSLPTHDFSWPEWKILISKMFPDNSDFVTTLKHLVTRVKHSDETMASYYFTKMYLIEACKITGEDAVSCLIDGLNNQDIQEQAKQLNFMTPESLYSQFLMNLPEYKVDYTPIGSSAPLMEHYYYQEPEESQEILIAQEESPEYINEMRHENITDFRRPTSVHERLDKRFIGTSLRTNKLPLAARVCSICSKRGHLARNCRKSDKLMKLVNQEADSRFVKQCTVNGYEVGGMIDTGCTTITITEHKAKQLHLQVCKCTNKLEVYGGGFVETVGETFFDLGIDSVQSEVRAVVVPDSAQDVSLIVGQEFICKKNVGMHMTKGILFFSEAQH